MRDDRVGEDKDTDKETDRREREASSTRIAARSIRLRDEIAQLVAVSSTIQEVNERTNSIADILRRVRENE